MGHGRRALARANEARSVGTPTLLASLFPAHARLVTDMLVQGRVGFLAWEFPHCVALHCIPVLVELTPKSLGSMGPKHPPTLHCSLVSRTSLERLESLCPVLKLGVGSKDHSISEGL